MIDWTNRLTINVLIVAKVWVFLFPSSLPYPSGEGTCVITFATIKNRRVYL